MCQFKSALVFQNGDIFASHWTDSHSDLIRMKGVRENDRVAFARVEFRPEATEDPADITKYRLILDELRTPDWWTEDMEHKVREHMKRLVSSMLVLDGEHDLLIGRQCIIGGSAKVAELRTCLVNYIGGSATVDYIGGSATVDRIGGSAKVGCISGSAKVDCIGGSAKVDCIGSSATVDRISDSATVVKDERVKEAAK